MKSCYVLGFMVWEMEKKGYDVFFLVSQKEVYKYLQQEVYYFLRDKQNVKEVKGGKYYFESVVGIWVQRDIYVESGV